MRMSLKSMPTFFMLSIARSLYIDAHTPCGCPTMLFSIVLGVQCSSFCSCTEDDR